MFNVKKTYKAYIDLSFFSFYFIFVICKNSVLFQPINVGTATNNKLPFAHFGNKENLLV